MDDESGEEDNRVNLSRRSFTKKAALFGAGIATLGPAAFADDSDNAALIEDNQQEVKPIRRLSGRYAYIHGEDQPLGNDLCENADQPFYTASLIKLVTLACVFEKIKAGELNWDDKIEVSNRAMTMSEHTSWNKEMSVREACEMAGSISLNDAAIALAEHMVTGGVVDGYVTDKRSEELEQQFVEGHMMPLVERLGMHNTLCTNATGFPIYSKAEELDFFQKMEDEPNNHSTLEDMAILTSHILDEYGDSEYMDVFSVPHVQMYAQNPTRIYSSNMLLPGNKRRGADPVDGVSGMKSGYINSSGYNLICTKEVDGCTLVSMTIGSDKDGRTSDPKEALEAAVSAYKHRQIAALDLDPQ